MKSLLVAFWLITAFSLRALAEDVQDDSREALSVAILPSKDKSGSLIIEREGTFQVVFRNGSEKPIRLWNERCRLGHGSLAFRVENGDDPSSLMHKRVPHSSAWKNTPLKTTTIPPGGSFSWKISLSAFFWGEREWEGVPEPNTGKPAMLTAIFEIKPDDSAKEHGVWTGRITSKPVETLVVDAKLKTPHDYLWAGYPKQALRVMKADRTWINKRDDMERTPLHLAARFGFVDLARWLLSQGADVDATAYNRFTPLLYTRDPEVIKLLLKHKADVNAKNSSGRTALEEAASWCGHFGRWPEFAAERNEWQAITKLLLDAGAEYDLRSACYLNDVERVRVLVKDKKKARDTEAMRQAATYGHANIVKLLLEHGADPEDADYGGLTVSYFAIEHPNVLKLLFDAGADPKVRVEYHGNGQGPQGSTLLHEAAEKGLVESAKLLVSRGIRIDVTTPSGATPLHSACSGGHLSMVQWLLQNKANAKARSNGWTPMALAAYAVRPDKDEDNAQFQAVIRALERAGVEPDVFAAIACNDVRRVRSILQANPKAGESKDPSGQPALHQAVMLDNKEIVKVLLDKGCDPDTRSADKNSFDGGTALLTAAFWGRLEIAETLIKHRANVNAKDAGGVAPLHEAARMQHLELARLLLKHGADVNAKDDKGQTPLDWGRSYHEAPEMSDLLRKHGGEPSKPKKRSRDQDS